MQRSIAMQEYKLELLAPAWHELEIISDTHLSLAGPESAEKITSQILNSLECLKTTPYMGRICEEMMLSTDNYRKLISGRYICFYKVISDTVYVYHIVNGKRDYPGIFEEEQKNHS